jgi:hypothetical protein
MSERQYSYQFYTQNDSFYKQKSAQKIIDELKSGIKRALFGLSEVDWKELGYCCARRNET